MDHTEEDPVLLAAEPSLMACETESKATLIYTCLLKQVRRQGIEDDSN